MNASIRLKFVVVLVGLLALNKLAEAADENCTDYLRNTVGSFLGIKEFKPRQQGGVIISESCKPWPYNTTLLLTAFAYDTGVEYEKNLIVAVIDSKTKRVLSDYQSVINEDAITEVDESSFWLDTARYQLANNVRAFGLRFNNSAIGASCGEANWDNELMLFVPEEKRLRLVLNNLFMYQQKSIRGCLSVQDKDAIWEDANLSVSIQKTSSNGYYDLLVTANITPISNNEIEYAATPRIEHYLLRYNGKTYEKSQNYPWWIGFQ